MTDRQHTSALPPEEVIVQLEGEKQELQRQVDELRQQLAERDSRINTQELIGAQQAATIQLLQASLTQEKPVLDPNLPEHQRSVLQAILDLPEDAFTEAEKLMEPLEGQPMTEVFARSINAILKKRDWRVTCPQCSKQSMITWHRNGTTTRCREGGRAEFVHAHPSPHRVHTKICIYKFLNYIDQRKKKTSE